MDLLTVFLIGLSLSMDAFAVSIANGMSIKNIRLSHVFLIAGVFGVFQALMPIIGYYLTRTFSDAITSFDHWIAFVLLGLIGANMIKEALSKDEEKSNASMGFKDMLTLAIATSIDALAVGITFALLPDVNIGAAVGFIGLTTFVLSAAGIKIGNIFGSKYKSKAELTGGIILILMGAKILLEHLGVFS